MKLMAFLLFVVCMQLSAKTYTQQITLSVKDAPLEKVFKEIQQQAGWNFVYANDVLQNAKHVTVNVKSVNVQDVLKLIFANQPLTYTVVENVVVVKIKESPNGEGHLLTTDNSQLTIDITGKVTDQDGNPLAGATVRVKETNQTTTTNADGVFTLKGVDGNATLEVSYTEHETLTIKIDNRTSIFVSLKPSETKLQEVIVNKGYYTEKRKLSTGDVTRVTSKEIEKQPVNNPLLALEGRVPGLVVTQSTGVSGGAVQVQIRGVNSIAQGKSPLFIVDGVPYGTLPTLSLQGLASNILGDDGKINPLSFLNSNDIESIEVLKDADATAIYGSRGSNGVILITTKKGKAGMMTVDVNVRSGFGKATRMANLMNTSQYLEMRNEALKNNNASPSSTDYDINGKWSKESYTDWEKFFIGGTAHYNDVEAAISGGNDNTQYRIGTGYHKETTVFPMPKDFADQKTSVQFNVSSHSLNKRFNFLLSGVYLNDNNKLPATDFTQYIFLAPNAPSLYNPDGSLNWSDFTSNPLREKYRNYDLNSKNLVSNSVLQYQILPGLFIKTNLGYTNTIYNEKTATFVNYFAPTAPYRLASFNNYSTNTWIIEPQLNYQRILGRSTFNSLIGATAQERKSEGQQIDGFDYASDALLGSLAAATTISKGQTIFEQYRYNSIFARLGYDWDQTYLLNLTLRRDGSSRFGPGKQFGNFGAVGVGWVFSKLSFVQKSLSFLTYGKLRASYGTTGNEPGQSYQYLELFNFTGNNPYQGGVGVTPNNLPAPKYSWEVNKKLEVAIELSFFNDRVAFDVDYFRNRSGNQLVQTSLPSLTGFFSVTTNLPAIVQNKGWEIMLNSLNISTKQFTWHTTFNITFAQNKLTDFPDLAKNIYYRNSLVIGQPITIRKLFKYAGVNPQSGVYLFYDNKGNLTSTPDQTLDRLALINTIPTYYGGLQNTINFKKFQLDFLFQFVKSVGYNNLFSANFQPGRFSASSGGNQPIDVLNRWQKAGDITIFQKFIPGSNSTYSTYAKASDIAYSDASFIRLKNIALSYKVPDFIIKKMRLSNLTLYIQGQNLLTITKYKGADPENQTMFSLPPLKMLVGGIQLSL